jgi:hypothetical protein
MGVRDAGTVTTEQLETEAVTTRVLLARLEALAARLDDQAAEMAGLKAENAAQAREITRLKDALPRAATPPAGASVAARVGRRGMLTKALGATAAAALLTVAKEAATADASSRTSVIGPSQSNYGIAATFSTGGVGSLDDPNVLIGNTSGKTFGMIGVMDNPSISPPANAGVLGQGASYYGVIGLSNSGRGVQGMSLSNDGVRGEIPAASTANAIAVYGLNNSSYAGPGPGAGGFGVYGFSAKGHGLVGATAAAGAAALVGASNGVAGAYAGVFYGPVVVSGAFTVVGGPKSAAVPGRQGHPVRLYCVEAPEAWFEDYGTGQLVSGRAEVQLDPDFAAVVETGGYHVFITEHDDHHGLTVKGRGPAGFTVQADEAVVEVKGKQAAQVNGTFSWRVVARRKDAVGKRLERVEIPNPPVLPKVDDRPPASDKPDRERTPTR